MLCRATSFSSCRFSRWTSEQQTLVACATGLSLNSSNIFHDMSVSRHLIHAAALHLYASRGLSQTFSNIFNWPLNHGSTEYMSNKHNPFSSRNFLDIFRDLGSGSQPRSNTEPQACWISCANGSCVFPEGVIAINIYFYF